jgi:hypothetical protein
MADTDQRIIFRFLTPFRIVGWPLHSYNFFCEPTVLFDNKNQKTIYVFISVKCLIIGFILCRINNDINKDDDYEVEDKNNYNDKNNLLRLMLFFKQQATDFMFAPCINSIKTLFIIATDAHNYKIIGMLKTIKIQTIFPTCRSNCLKFNCF